MPYSLTFIPLLMFSFSLKYSLVISICLSPSLSLYLTIISQVFITVRDWSHCVGDTENKRKFSSIVVQTCNFRSWKTEAGGLSFLGQPGPHSKSLAQGKREEGEGEKQGERRERERERERERR
jgi:hypothetical protein